MAKKIIIFNNRVCIFLEKKSHNEYKILCGKEIKIVWKTKSGEWGEIHEDEYKRYWTLHKRLYREDGEGNIIEPIDVKPVGLSYMSGILTNDFDYDPERYINVSPIGPKGGIDVTKQKGEDEP